MSAADRPSGKGRSTRSRWLRRLIALGVVVFLVANVAVNPWCAKIRSLALMSGYDWVYERDSVPHDTGIRADMPLDGTELYPLMVTFNDDAGMSQWLGEDVRFTVDFTFADFEPWRGYSGIYDPENPLYGAYVGSYYVQGLGRELTDDEVTKIAEFDQRRLALPALGLGYSDNEFTVLTSESAPVEFSGHDWTNYQASIVTNCPAHSPDGFQISHLQFGGPPASSEQYPLCQMSAQIDVGYFPDQDLTIGLYVLSTSADTTSTLRGLTSLRTQIVRR
ncbi:hypothetical protein [Propionimicrobium sp. PCR01-08-3]|uniref:hypothetical protein n=1 Tax=Propionimicrobium sp. PCR01-08-3 TaxID=3052086 RepID=UPI00255C6B70|nr:hypothetical protein [Propionimicrobium sp. PCR01-08-3]WIY81757.1 hypothetical protein QQ658_09500 [Propionimicrobium sp. PCR01-08-3]